ncbi:hypothetical protein QNH91_26235, partial [Klebsiella pneumoniae]|nr:hypothetical protein [Klebsiella pneumoniae]
RSGAVWLAHSRRYGDLKQVLVPMIAAQENAKLALPSNPQDWLADRTARLTIALKRLARAARKGTIPHGSIEDGTLRIDRLTEDVPDGAEALILDMYRRMPSVRITDMLLEVDAALGFTCLLSTYDAAEYTILVDLVGDGSYKIRKSTLL